MRTLLIVLSLFSLLPIYTNAQDSIKVFPGSKWIEYGKIKPHVLKYRFSAIRNGEKKDVGIYTDSVAFIKRDGRKFMIRYASMPANAMHDTAIYEMKTLVPISNREHSRTGKWLLQYEEGQVSGTSIQKPKDSLIAINEKMVCAYFDGYMNDFVPRYLKFQEGLHYKLPLYAFGMRGVTWVDVTIGVKDKVVLNNKTYETVIVEVRWPKSPALTQFYVDPNTRELMKIRIQWPGGEVLKERIN